MLVCTPRRGWSAGSLGAQRLAVGCWRSQLAVLAWAAQAVDARTGAERNEVGRPAPVVYMSVCTPRRGWSAGSLGAQRLAVGCWRSQLAVLAWAAQAVDARTGAERNEVGRPAPVVYMSVCTPRRGWSAGSLGAQRLAVGCWRSQLAVLAWAAQAVDARTGAERNEVGRPAPVVYILVLFELPY